ncbi:EscU/YscU/HrcU family type III secretion system export apparatus switch protein [Chelativorans sp. Marseille-P2723]|uniref:EscU/YscU/HrcU family type III secretion system export apparatus switch protein n=1 Tax=Chelativorans sp. Marseille-P2723 TaxID=2709133 RepID=UPI00156FF7F4|nr:EscU/YscU/HrcU family type III secretion system export apparatus switch protein [Chelativorans sp. Marseille-P2723]
MSGEKTEAPTPHRLDERRKEGQVPQRRNVIEAALLTFTLLLIAGLFDRLSKVLLDLSTAVFSNIDEDFGAAWALSLPATLDALYFILAICAASSLFSVLFGMLMNKFLFAPKALSIKFQKLNPVNQVKSIFSKSTLYNFVRLLVFFFSVCVILYISIYANIENSLNASYCGEACLYPLFVKIIRTAIISILIALLVMAAIDYRIQSLLFISQNKMTKDEVKREYKGQEGDPEIKAGRKSIAVSDATMPLPSEATHVVHSDQVLVALIFYPGVQQPPYIVFKAKGARVPVLRRRFASMKIPTINQPGAALELYRAAPVGQYLSARAARNFERILRASMS